MRGNLLLKFLLHFLSEQTGVKEKDFRLASPLEKADASGLCQYFISSFKAPPDIFEYADL
jgi:hypothetical protein